jgi:hypothetical protein
MCYARDEKGEANTLPAFLSIYLKVNYKKFVNFYKR